MSKRIYVDSNIYIDYFENRSDKLIPWGEFAHKLFQRTFECEFKVIISSFIIKELNNNGYDKEINDLKSEFESY
jgi:hypothetical protein